MYMGAFFALYIAAGLIFGLRPPEVAPASVSAAYGGVLFSAWLLVMPALQYVLIRRFSGLTPRLSWAALYPHVFGPWYAPGARLYNRPFALLCAIPALCVALVLLPVGVVAYRAGVQMFPEIALLVGGALSLYFLRYSVWALSKPRRVRVEVLEEPGMVRADY